MGEIIYVSVGSFHWADFTSKNLSLVFFFYVSCGVAYFGHLFIFYFKQNLAQASFDKTNNTQQKKGD